MDRNKNYTSAYWQIILPLILMIAAVGGGLYFLVFRQLAEGMVSQSSDIAAIYLLFLFAGPVLITLTLLIVFITLNGKAARAISAAFPGIAEKADQINKAVRGFSRAAANPFIELDAHYQAVKHIFTKKESNGK